MLRPTVGTLESHMFEEMGRPIRRIRFCPRACIYPDTDSSSMRIRVRLGRNREPIRECRDFGHWGVGTRGGCIACN
jgi:hypothetical protein